MPLLGNEAEWQLEKKLTKFCEIRASKYVLTGLGKQYFKPNWLLQSWIEFDD